MSSKINSFTNYFVVLGILTLVLWVTLGMEDKPPEDAWFKSVVLESEVPVVVKFGATWCGPCQSLEQELYNLEARRSDRIRVVRIDIAERPDLVQHFRVSRIPRLFLFNGGHEIATSVGSRDCDALEQWIDSNIPKS